MKYYSLPQDTVEPNLISANDFIPNPDPDFIVQDLLLPGQISLFAGPSNLGKSCIVAAIASHVAMEREICGMRTTRAAVFYVAAEAPTGVLNRAYPYMKRPNPEAAPFSVYPSAVDLSDRKSARKLTQVAQKWRDDSGCDHLLIIVDTLSLCIGDGNDNTSQGTTPFLRNVREIVQQTNAHMLIVHHTGSADSSRPRGSTNLIATVDTGLILNKANRELPEGTVYVEVCKQREQKKARPLVFQIKGYEIGKNRFGETSTIPWAEPVEINTAEISFLKPSAGKSRRKSLAEQRRDDLLKILSLLNEEGNGAWHSHKSLENMTGQPFDNIRGNSSTLRRKVKDGVKELVKEGMVEEGSEGVRLRVGMKNSVPPTDAERIR